MTAEAGLRARVLFAVRQQWPRSAGVLLRGNPASAATGPGHPDIDGVVRSRPIALELKKARGKPTPLQILRLRDLRNAGCYAWIVRSPYEACEAVYWVAKGWTRPLSNEPLDLNAWLTGDPPKTEAAPYQPNMTVAPETWDTPAHQEAAAQVLGYESAEERNQALTSTGRQPTVEEMTAVVKDQPQTFNVDSSIGIIGALAKLDADIRAVGDRVTILWERQEMFLAVLQGIDHKVSVILGMIQEDPGADIDESTSVELNGANANAEAAFLADNDTGDTMEPQYKPEPIVKRKRRSRAEMDAARAAEAAAAAQPRTLDDIPF